MSSEVISVIVPVYNVEPYVERCVRSLMAQTYKPLEIILVDDGSTDKSGKICDALAEEDSRIKVFHQENAGVSAARNAALAVAKGTWVGFCDSDDWVENDMYEILHCLVTENSADVGVLRPINEWTDSTSFFEDDDTVHIMTGIEAMVEMHRGQRFSGTVWDKLIRREIIEGKAFDENIFVHEDMMLMGEVFSGAKSVAYQGVHKYHYFIRDESAMHVISEKYWTMQSARRLLVEQMEKYCPEERDVAVVSLIRANLTLLEKLGDRGQLTEKDFKRAAQQMIEYKTLKNKKLLSRYERGQVLVSRFGKWPYECYCWLYNSIFQRNRS